MPPKKEKSQYNQKSTGEVQNALLMPNSLDGLPDELIARIYSYLSRRERAAASYPNRHIYRVNQGFFGAAKLAYARWQFEKRDVYIQSANADENYQRALDTRMIYLADILRKYPSPEQQPELYLVVDGVFHLLREQQHEMLEKGLLWDEKSGIDFDSLIAEDNFFYYAALALLGQNASFLQLMQAKLSSCLDNKVFAENLNKLVIISLMAKRKDIYQAIQQVVGVSYKFIIDSGRATAKSSVCASLEENNAALKYEGRRIYYRDRRLTENSDNLDFAFDYNYLERIAVAVVAELRLVDIMETLFFLGNIVSPVFLACKARRLDALKFLSEETSSSEIYMKALKISLENSFVEGAEYCWSKLSMLDKRHVASDIAGNDFFEKLVVNGQIESIQWLWKVLEVGALNVHKGTLHPKVFASDKADALLRKAVQTGNMQTVGWLLEQGRKSERHQVLDRMQEVFFFDLVEKNDTVSIELLWQLCGYPRCQQLAIVDGYSKAVNFGYKEMLLWLWDKASEAQRDTIKASAGFYALGEEFADQIKDPIQKNVIELIMNEIKGIDIMNINKHDKIADIIAAQFKHCHSIDDLLEIFDAVGIGAGNNPGQHQTLCLLRQRKVGLGLISKVTYRETDDSEKIARAGIKHGQALLRQQQNKINKQEMLQYRKLFDRQTVRKEGRQAAIERRDLLEWFERAVVNNQRKAEVNVL